MAAVMVSMGWKRLRLGCRLVLAPADCTRRPASRGPDTGAAELGLTRVEIASRASNVRGDFTITEKTPVITTPEAFSVIVKFSREASIESARVRL